MNLVDVAADAHVGHGAVEYPVGNRARDAGHGMLLPILKATDMARAAAPEKALGHLSYLLLCLIAQTPEKDCYGATLKRKLAEIHDEHVTLATVYVTLARLDEKQLIRANEQQAPDSRHKVLKFRLLAEGKTAIKQTAAFYRRLAEASPV